MRIMGAATTSAPSASSARTSSSACSRARVTAMRRPSRGGREERGDCDIRVISSNVPLTALRSRPLCRAPGRRLPAPRPQTRGLVARDRLRTDARVRRALPRARAAAAGHRRPLGGARRRAGGGRALSRKPRCVVVARRGVPDGVPARSEEHTSELQSLAYLVCRLLLEKKKKKNNEYDDVN